MLGAINFLTLPYPGQSEPRNLPLTSIDPNCGMRGCLFLNPPSWSIQTAERLDAGTHQFLPPPILVDPNRGTLGPLVLNSPLS